MIEDLYKKAFDEIEPVPNDLLLKGVVEKMNRKPKKRRILLTAVAAVLIFATTAVAAQIVSRNWDWLAQRLGEDEAARFQPVELSGFASENPYRIGVITNENDVRAEIMAVGVGDSEIDVFILLEDLSETRIWGDEILISPTIYFTDPTLRTRESTGHTTEFNVFDRDDSTRTAVFHSRMGLPSISTEVDLETVNTRDLTIIIDEVTFDYEIHTEEIEVNLVEITEHMPQIYTLRQEDVFLVSTPHIHFIPTVGFKMLKANTQNIPFEIANIPMSITAAGIIGDRLHIQIYTNNMVLAFPYLLGADGEVIEVYAQMNFSLDENGEITSNSFTDDFGRIRIIEESGYSELIFDTIPENLEAYKLFATTITHDTIYFNQGFSFELQGDTEFPQHLPNEIYRGSGIPGLDPDWTPSPRANARELITTIYQHPQSDMIISGELFTEEMPWFVQQYVDIDAGARRVFFFAPDTILCVEDDVELLPPELKDEILYKAEQIFAERGREFSVSP